MNKRNLYIFHCVFSTIYSFVTSLAVISVLMKNFRLFSPQTTAEITSNILAISEAVIGLTLITFGSCVLGKKRYEDWSAKSNVAVVLISIASVLNSFLLLRIII